MQLPVRTYLVDNLLATLLKAALPLGIYFYLIRHLVMPDYTRLCACVALQALLFIPTAYFFIISETERRFIKSTFGFEINENAQIGYGTGPLNDTV